MTEPSITDVYERLGRLTASVEGIRTDIAVSEEHSRDHREKVFTRLEDMSIRTGRLEHTVTKLEPTVNSLSNLKAKAAGAIIVLGAIGAVLGWIASYFATELKALVIRVFGG
jgi:hypothetical protein